MLNFILGIILAGASLALLIYLLRLLLAALGLPMAGAWERWRLHQRRRLCQRADARLQRGDADVALRLLHAAFHLGVTKDLAIARAITNHHAAILSRLLAITSDSQGGSVRLLSLAKVDRLLAERRELQHSYIAARQSPGKQQRRQQILSHLASNRRELEGAIKQLIEEVHAARKKPMYH